MLRVGWFARHWCAFWGGERSWQRQERRPVRARSAARKAVKVAHQTARTLAKSQRLHRPKRSVADFPRQSSQRRRFRTRAAHATPNIATSAWRRPPAAWCRRMSFASCRRAVRKKSPSCTIHDVEFQMIYVLKGWIKTELEGQGAHVMRPGSAWIQPPKIKHKVLDYSDDARCWRSSCRRISRRWTT